MKERHGFDGKSMGSEDALAQDAVAREEIALRLTLEAMRQSQRAMVGMLALPASLALGVAATVSYAAAFLERGFQTFELSLSRLARDAHELAERRDEHALFAGTPGESEQLSKTVRS
ncbi:MAG TPA: hypothetical protein VGL86_26915 [Polyangia bacterium]|jgi:hypothetical protein